MRAFLKNYRQSPRKVRLVGNLIKGKNVSEAVSVLGFLPKRASSPIKKLLVSAASNAKHNDGIEMDKLIIKNVTVDKGLTMRRLEYKARGSANVLHKRSSNVIITLGTKTEAPGKKVAKVKVEKKTAVKKTSKK